MRHFLSSVQYDQSCSSDWALLLPVVVVLFHKRVIATLFPVFAFPSLPGGVISPLVSACQVRSIFCSHLMYSGYGSSI